MCQNRLQNAQIQSKGSLNRQRGGTYDFSCDNKGNMIVSSYNTTVVTCATRYFRCLSENVSTTKRFWSKAEIKRIYLPITKAFEVYNQKRSSRPPNPPIGGGPRPTLGAQVSLKLLFGYVTIFSSADLFTTDLNCRKKLACDIISEFYIILSRRI